MADIRVQEHTYNSIIEDSIHREIKNKYNKKSSRTSDSDFTQTENFEEAVKFAKEGWDLGLEQYKIEDGVLSSGTTILSPSLAGCIPHVQNHIMGFPQEMYQLFDDREYNLPTLDVIVNLGYSGSTDSEDTLEFGKCLVNYINTMASNYNIRLTGVFAVKQGSINDYDIVYLKKFDETLVINNIAFALHPSFFRRIWFGIAESKEYLSSGYGKAIKTDYHKVVMDKLGSESDKTIVFKCLEDLNNFKFTPDNIEGVTIKI
tara:strand:+ start:29 stop:808 length:780 start_codon:yes stop_codon:yes gene_type:complete